MAQLRRALWIGAAAAVAAALLAGSGVTARESGVPPEKALLEQHLEHAQAVARAEALKVPKPPDPTAERPTPLPPAPPPTGIVELPSPFPAREYTLQATGWQEATGARRVTVYAGALGSDRTRGVLVVVTTIVPVEAERIVSVYQAPAADGSLRIVGARGRLLELQAEDDAQLSFDVSSRRFG